MTPLKKIRRYDIFAEYYRQKNIIGGMDESRAKGEAKGEAIWFAKVVASRKNRGYMPNKKSITPSIKFFTSEQTQKQKEWKELSGIPQTDALFDKEIIDRMGCEFYYEVFVPAIKKAIEEGKKYEDIRDNLEGIRVVYE